MPAGSSKGGGGAGVCNAGCPGCFNCGSPYPVGFKYNVPGGNPGGGYGGRWGNACYVGIAAGGGQASAQDCLFGRAAGGGGAALINNPCNTSGGGGGGAGRGGAGNPGGSGGSGGAGANANPTVYNCISVTPGGSYPISVATGGQVYIQWNAQ